VPEGLAYLPMMAMTVRESAEATDSVSKHPSPASRIRIADTSESVSLQATMLMVAHPSTSRPMGVRHSDISLGSQ
jgi:hypothetical protein